MLRNTIRSIGSGPLVAALALGAVGCARGPLLEPLPMGLGSPWVTSGEAVGTALPAEEIPLLEDALRLHRGPPWRVTWIDRERLPATPGGEPAMLDEATEHALFGALAGLGFCLASEPEACTRGSRDAARIRVSEAYRRGGDTVRLVTSWQYIGLEGEQSDPVGNVFLFVRDGDHWRLSARGATDGALERE